MSDVLAEARARAARRDAARPRIDYDRMKRVFPKQKAALTRATNSGDVDKVVNACIAAMNEWDEIGCWPDDWARWQRALDDMLPWNQQVDISDLRR